MNVYKSKEEVSKTDVQSPLKEKLKDFLQRVGLPDAAKYAAWALYDIENGSENLRYNIEKLIKTLKKNLNDGHYNDLFIEEMSNGQIVKINANERITEIVTWLEKLQKMGDDAIRTNEIANDLAYYALYIYRAEGAKYGRWQKYDYEKGNEENYKYNTAYIINIFEECNKLTGTHNYDQEIEDNMKSLRQFFD